MIASGFAAARRRALRRLVGALAVAFCGFAAAAAPTVADSGDIAVALRHRGLKGASVGALVIDAATGAEIFARGADQPMVAASNVKVLTALAALATFGPTHRFVTEIRSDRLPDRNGAVGRLVLVGGGDPSLTSEQMWRLAANLAATGLRRVDGDVILDASVFDDQLWNPAWGGTSARAYHAPVAGLQVNYGAFTVEVSPGDAAGAPPRVFVDPNVAYFNVVNRASTKAGRSSSIEVGRSAAAGTDTVTVSGSIGSGAQTQHFARSVTQPVEYAGHVFAHQLAANGITVGGTLRIGRAAPGDFLLHQFDDGKPLSEIVRLFMKYSNNNIAESLVKSMGRWANPSASGSWASGTAAMRAKLIELGLAPASFTLLDGSGLSRDDRVTPRALVTALRVGSSSFTYGTELIASLPIANRDGTLQRRAGAARDVVRAKTGLLNGATALSGIARDATGRRLLFSVIANGYSQGDLEAMAALDAFAAAVAAQ